MRWLSKSTSQQQRAVPFGHDPVWSWDLNSTRTDFDHALLVGRRLPSVLQRLRCAELDVRWPVDGGLRVVCTDVLCRSRPALFFDARLLVALRLPR